MITLHGGSCAKRHRMRCNACRRAGSHGRFTLKVAPKFMKREPTCPLCDSNEVVSVEKQRRKEQQRQDTCHCLMIPFPHRKGSILGCETMFDAEWTKDQWKQYDGMLRTPRGG